MYLTNYHNRFPQDLPLEEVYLIFLIISIQNWRFCDVSENVNRQSRSMMTKFTTCGSPIEICLIKKAHRNCIGPKLVLEPVNLFNFSHFVAILSVQILY